MVQFGISKNVLQKRLQACFPRLYEMDVEVTTEKCFCWKWILGDIVCSQELFSQTVKFRISFFQIP